jgi:nitrate/TMAO reductase-like tetraheme cytochrome c subunit
MSRSRRLIIWVAGGALLATVAVLAWAFAASATFCGACHEMDSSVQGWQSGPHGEKEWAACRDCHAGGGIRGALGMRINMAHYVRVHLGGDAGEPALDAVVEPEWCVRCHEDEWEDAAFADDHPTKQSPCALCHRGSAHANQKPSYSANPAQRAEGQTTCVECHLDDELLEADLKADPPAEQVQSECEG